MPPLIPSIAAPASTAPAEPRRAEADDPLREVAQKLEATFLAEMLKSAGLGEARKSFGGGPGEEQFASFLRQAQADAMVRKGGIGLAETLYNALKETRDE